MSAPEWITAIRAGCASFQSGPYAPAAVVVAVGDAAVAVPRVGGWGEAAGRAGALADGVPHAARTLAMVAAPSAAVDRVTKRLRDRATSRSSLSRGPLHCTGHVAGHRRG